MAYSKVSFHVAANCAGCNGIADSWRRLNEAGIPFAVYSANDAGLIAQAAQYQRATLIYRDVEASTVNPVDYSSDPEIVATFYWQRTLNLLPANIKELKDRCWIELLNEPGKEGDQAGWVGRLMYHMARLALRDGYRVMGPGWSPGTPEPVHWETPGWELYLRLAASNPDRVAVSLHEYSLDNDIHNGESWLIGRFRFLFDACDAMHIARPKVWITECGWTLNSMPPDEQAQKDIAFLAGLYAGYPQIQAASLWTLQGGAGNGNLPSRLNALIPWLTEYTVKTRFPDPAGPPPVEPPPPVDPPPASAVNLLTNGSFEEGWTDATTFPGQHPLGWEVVWNTGMDNPHAPWQYMVGEGVHKSDAFLPPAERDVFIWDGEWTYKLFADKKAFWARLKQRLDLPAGKYRLTTPVWVDCYRWNGFKDYAVEPWQAETMVKVNQAEVKPWSLMVSGGKATPVTEFDHAGGVADLAVHFRCNWPISNNLWLDGWSLSKVTVTEPPPVDPPPPDDDDAPYRMTVVLLPPVLTESEALTIYKQRFPNKNTIAYSWDDARALLDSPRSADTSELIAYGLYRWPDAARAEIMAYNPVVQAVPAPPPPPVTPPPVVDTRPIIDISHHQGTLNWDRFAPKVQAVVIRIGNGYTEDTQARRNCAEAIKRGVPFATYHYFQPVLDPLRQGEFYGRLAAEIAPGRLCCVDLEEPTGLDSNTAAKARAYINALSAIVDHDPMIYTSLNYWTQLGRPAWGIEYPLWIAAWTTAARPIVPAPFGDWTLWQYAVDTINPAEWGVQSTRLDFNRFNPRWGTAADYFDDTWYDDAPAPSAIDLLPYLRGDGRLYEVRHPDGSQERFQTQTDGQNFYLVKNSQWEQLYADDQYIWRGLDTSPGNGRFYKQFEPLLNRARWMPRRMTPGQTWIGPGHMVHFYVKETCARSAENSGPATNRMTFVARHAARTWNGITVNDVVELTNGTETWFYARGFGLVAWSAGWGQSAISEIHAPGTRPDNVREKLNCNV